MIAEDMRPYISEWDEGVQGYYVISARDRTLLVAGPFNDPLIAKYYAKRLNTEKITDCIK